MNGIKQLLKRHRAKVVGVGSFLIVFGTITLSFYSRPLAPMAAVALAVFTYIQGQSNGYAAGHSAGVNQGRREVDEEVTRQAQEMLARLEAGGRA